MNRLSFSKIRIEHLDLLFMFFFSLFVGLLGLWPHLRFRLVYGSGAFFKSAYDEDIYFQWIREGVDVSRPLSHLAYSIAEFFFGPAYSRFFAIADFLFPALIALVLSLLVLGICSSWSLRLIGAAAVLFGGDFLSLSNSLVFDRFHIESIKNFIGSSALQMVPDSSTSYLNLFRSPEPQVSWLLLSILFLTLSRFSLNLGQARKFFDLGLYVLGALLALSYSFVAAASLVLLLALLVLDRVFKGRGLFAASLKILFSFSLALISSLFLKKGRSESAQLTLFDSHLISLSPAVFLASLLFFSGLAILIWYRGLAVQSRNKVILSLGLALAPILLMNQQVITGIMVSTRDWERYVNYPFISFSAVLLISVAYESWQGTRRLIELVSLILFLSLGVSVVSLQDKVFKAWLPENLKSHQVAHAIQSLPDLYASHSIVVDQGIAVPHLRLIGLDGSRFVTDFSRLFLDPVPSIEPKDEGMRWQSPHQDALFLSLAHQNISVEEFSGFLSLELVSMNGFHLSHLFSFRDAWYPLSDARKTNKEGVLTRIPQVTNGYAEFLRTGRSRAPTLLVLSYRNIERLSVEQYEVLVDLVDIEYKILVNYENTL